MRSELETYYEAFCSGYWVEEDANYCPCKGSGWALSDVDTWHKCPAHYRGQRHPEDEAAYWEALEAWEKEKAKDVFVTYPVYVGGPLVKEVVVGEDDVPF